MELSTGFLERFAKGAVLYIDHRPYTVLSQFKHKSQVRVQLEGIDTIEQGELLIGHAVEVPSDVRPEMEEDEFYVGDLIGMDVVTTEGQQLGSVTKVLTYPAQDLLQVDKLLIPAIEEFVKEIDLEKRLITVKLLPGMLELNQ